MTKKIYKKITLTKKLKKVNSKISSYTKKLDNNNLRLVNNIEKIIKNTPAKELRKKLLDTTDIAKTERIDFQRTINNLKIENFYLRKQINERRNILRKDKYTTNRLEKIGERINFNSQANKILRDYNIKDNIGEKKYNRLKAQTQLFKHNKYTKKFLSNSKLKQVQLDNKEIFTTFSSNFKKEKKIFFSNHIKTLNDTINYKLLLYIVNITQSKLNWDREDFKYDYLNGKTRINEVYGDVLDTIDELSERGLTSKESLLELNSKLKIIDGDILEFILL